MRVARDTVVHVVGVICVVAILWVFRSELLTGLVASGIAVVSTLLSVVDFNEHQLPNRMTGPLAGFTAIAVFVLGVIDDDVAQAVTALGIGAAVFVGLFVLGLAGGIGMGDVKFSFPLAVMLTWLGSRSLQLAVLVMFLSAGIYTVAKLIRSRSMRMQIPFGPFMALGYVAGVLVAGPEAIV